MKKKRFGEGALLSGLALIGLASRQKAKGSRSICSACDTQQASLIEMAQTISDCNYNLPEMSQILSEVASASGRRGSLAKVTIFNLDEARKKGILNKADYGKFQSMLGWLQKNYPDLFEVATELISKCGMQQLKLLGNMGATTSVGGRYTQAVKMLKLAESVGVRNFMNRYLQRIAVLVPPSVSELPLVKEADDWRYEWTCEAMRKPIEKTISTTERMLARLGLDLNHTRVTYVYDTKRKKYLKTPLQKVSALKNLSMVAWFVAVAKACGVTRGSDLLFTYPVENVFTARGNIGNTVFTRLAYRMHLPGPSSSAESFPTAHSAFQITPESASAVVDSSLTQPYLYYYDRETGEPVTIIYYSYTAGSMTARRTTIFTVTEKMNAPSFSIPAGMPQAGGSCIASAYTASRPGIGVNDATFVCRKCYALKGHYMYLSYVFSAAPRMNWIVDNCRADLTGNRMGALLSLAMESYARYGRGERQKRSKLEFGVIRNQALIYPIGENSYSRFDSTPMVIGGTSQDFIDFSKTNEVAGYFRIHDSGDFTISNNNETNLAYINSWALVADAFRQVRFWVPTRAWSLGYSEIDLGETIDADALAASVAELEAGIGTQTAAKLGIGRLLKEGKKLWHSYVRAMNTASELSPNLVIRPSGLTIISPFTNAFISVPMLQTLDPSITHIAAGSGVNAVLTKSASKNKYTFTDTAFELVAFDQAFPPYSTGRPPAKKSIGDYLRQYFEKLYDGRLPKQSYTPVNSMDGSFVYQCPVNMETNPDGTARSSADSCLGSNCRVCWLKKEVPVTYGAH